MWNLKFCAPGPWISAIAVLAAPALSQPAETPDLAARLAALQERLERSRVDQHIPGMSLAIVLDDQVILARGFGVRDIEKQTPADPATVYPIGSSSKAFTSLLVGMMVDEGRMSWDEPIRTHAPLFHLSDPQADAQVTIRDVLCHRTGLARTDLLWYAGGASQEQMFAALATAELKSPFRSAFNYNNLGFLAAGTAAGNAAGSDWATLVRMRIFGPLGMSASNLSIDELSADPNASKGYLWDEATGEFTELPYRSAASCAPAGAINSTVLDMSRWVRLQLGRGQFEGKRLVSEESLGETWKHQIDMQPGAGYGLGWMLHDWNGLQVVEHGGNIDGFAAQVALLPDRNAGFVLLTNVSYTMLTVEAQNLVWEALFPPEGSASAAMSEGQMAPYTGKFRFDQMGIDITVLVKEGKLWCDVPGQTVFELKWPDADGKWAFAMTDTIKVSFERDAAGQVPSMTVFQAGLEFRLPRVNADGTVAKGPEEPSPFTAEQLREFTGTYHFADAKQDWRVQVKDGRLTVDVPGQTVYTLKWPDAEGKWALAVTDAVKLSFERDAEGNVNQLTCYQAGAVMPMPRTAPGEDDGLPTVEQVMALRRAQSDPELARGMGIIRTVGTMRFSEQGIDARVAGLSDIGTGRFRFDIDMGPFGAIRMASDGASVWSQSLSDRVETVTGDQAELIRRQATSMFVKDLSKAYERVEVLRKEQLDGRTVIVVRAGNAEGTQTVTEFVDPETGLAVKEQSTTTVPGLGPVPSEALYADYRSFDGLMIPTTIRVDSMGTGKGVLTITSVTPHAEASPADFTLVPEMK